MSQMDQLQQELQFDYTSLNQQQQLQSQQQHSELQSEYTSKRSSKSRQSKQNKLNRHRSKTVKSGSEYQKQSRNYGCPCGKFYLSAPALYTHVKIKHHGVPPGNLIRPAPHTGLRVRGVRGRAKYFKNSVIVQNVQQDSDCLFDAVQEIEKKLDNITLDNEYKFEASTGDHTCQDMASKFLHDIRTLSPQVVNIVHCYLNELKEFTELQLGKQFWQTKQPDQIVVIANDFIKNHNSPQFKNRYPIPHLTIIDLTYILCKWMYKQKWTNNKLIRRYSPTVSLPDPSSIIARRK